MSARKDTCWPSCGPLLCRFKPQEEVGEVEMVSIGPVDHSLFYYQTSTLFSIFDTEGNVTISRKSHRSMPRCHTEELQLHVCITIAQIGQPAGASDVRTKPRHPPSGSFNHLRHRKNSIISRTKPDPGGLEDFEPMSGTWSKAGCLDGHGPIEKCHIVVPVPAESKDG